MAKGTRVLVGSWLALAAGLLCLSGCASAKQRAARDSVVRKLSFPPGAQAQKLAVRSAEIADRLYPQVCALLREDGMEFPSSFAIGMKTPLRSGNVAETRMNEIWLNGDYAKKFHEDPAYFEDVMVHEMAHVAQKYYRPLIGKWLVYDMEPPKAWLEGIADYASFKLGFTNSWHCPECTSTYPHYRDGYSCAGAFLLFVEQKYHPQIVPRLNALLRKGGYTDHVFAEWTGTDLQSLWSEFQNTPAFTDHAASMLKFQQELGFRDGRPPKDIKKRIDALIASNSNRHLRRLVDGAQIPGLKDNDVANRMALVHYFTRAEGTAEQFMLGLLDKHLLPGFKKGDHGSMDSHLTHREMNQRYPASRSFSAQKQGTDSGYHYTVMRVSRESPWKLDRAWRTNPDGSVAEEFQLPEQ